MTMIVLLALVVAGPLLVVIGIVGLTYFISWGADCQYVQGSAECGDFLGLFAVNPEMVSLAGGGYAFAFALLWATGVLGILFIIGILVIIARALS